MSSTIETEVINAAREWDRAMIANDAREIGRFMADDWIIVGSDGRMTDKASFLSLIESGDLTHDVMESNDISVRVYGDTAVLLAHGVSGGQFRGHPFRENERQSNVFVRHANSWRCVLTHLSRLAES